VPTLQATIATKYFAKLRDSKDVDAGQITLLEELFASGKKIKVDELVKIFAAPGGARSSDQARKRAYRGDAWNP
jgi:hypothetical protein